MGVALVAAGTIAVTNTLASGNGSSDFDAPGSFAHQIRVDKAGLSGYSPAPFAYDTSHGAITGVPYDFTVWRFTGKHHVPSSQMINIPLVLRVSKVAATAKIPDSATSFAQGDPGKTGKHPPFEESYLLHNFQNVTETVVATTNFNVQLAATTDAQAAAQNEQFKLQFSMPGCGYYEIDTGRSDSSQPLGFAVLTSAFVRATPCKTTTTVSTPTPTPASQVQAASISTPNTGAGVDESGLWNGLMLIGMGLVLNGLSLRARRRGPRAAHPVP